MSQKIFGAALIIAALSLGALSYLKQHRERMRLLEQLSAALDMAVGELSLRALPLPRLFELLSGRTQGAAAEFFSALCEGMDRLGDENFSTLWDEAATGKLPGLMPEEREELMRLGAVLGRYELERQLEALHACSAVLGDALCRTRRDYPERRRLALGMSACAGALMIILLI